jgi:hypothetical protein
MPPSLLIIALVLGGPVLAFIALHAYAHWTIRDLDAAEAPVSAQPVEDVHVKTTRKRHADNP